MVPAAKKHLRVMAQEQLPYHIPVEYKEDEEMK